MFDADPSELAVRGERGIDLFQRVEDAGQKRARFRCIATVSDGDTPPQAVDFQPHANRAPEALIARAQALQEAPQITQSLALGDTRSWPKAYDTRNPMALFLYLEFFRAWQVADMAGARFEALLARDPNDLPTAPNQIAGAITPVFEFNRLARGTQLAHTIVPVLKARIAAQGFRDDQSSSTGYALRMLGDLCMRAANPALALECFETAIGAGDNAFRRRKAIEAAHAAGNTAKLQQHLTGFRVKWPLPDDLAQLENGADT